jgi:hypothetical protein
MKLSTAEEKLVCPADQPAYYEIRLEGSLKAHWSEWLGDMEITADPTGQTVLTGWIVDQSALFGVIARIRDLGLVLISVNRADNQSKQS